MKKLTIIKSIVSFIIILLTISCSDSSQIDEKNAINIIHKHLKTVPEYKTVKLNLGEIKFNSKLEFNLLDKYNNLESEGWIKMEQKSSKKKFLSKDSSYIYNIKLTDKASDYVINLINNSAIVKAVIYEIDPNSNITFNKVNNGNAKITVQLKKTNTPFAQFQKKPSDFSNFITKTYKLKFDKNEGWKVSN